MTHKKFKKLEFFERVDFLREYGVTVGLWRCINGGGEIKYGKGNVSIECETRDMLKAQLEHVFLQVVK
jgi:hypothetical protein